MLPATRSSSNRMDEDEGGEELMEGHTSQLGPDRFKQAMTNEIRKELFSEGRNLYISLK